MSAELVPVTVMILKESLDTLDGIAELLGRTREDLASLLLADAIARRGQEIDGDVI